MKKLIEVLLKINQKIRTYTAITFIIVIIRARTTGLREDMVKNRDLELKSQDKDSFGCFFMSST